MKNKYSIFAAFLASIFEIIFIVTLVFNIISGNLKNLVLYLISMFFLLLPFIITFISKKKDTLLPKSFQLITVLFIFSSQYLGEIMRFYDKFAWWDLILHAVAGGYISIIAFHLIQEIFTRDQNTSRQRFSLHCVIYTFSFSLAFGTLWEIFEFTGDYFFNTNMVKGGLSDTVSDLVVKAAAALTVSIIYYYKLVKN